jgi:kinesin family protein 18/19
MSLLKVGNRNRTKEATEVNQSSSRSHAVLSVVVESKEKNSGISESVVSSKFTLVDLAGSERASNTNNKGQRMVEGAKIN